MLILVAGASLVGAGIMLQPLTNLFGALLVFGA